MYYLFSNEGVNMLFDFKDKRATRAITLLLNEERAKGRTVGLTSGCFDLIHFQHFWYFIRCRRHCDILIVGVDSDEMVRREKGPTRPFIFDFKRAIMVDALKQVDFTFVMHGLPDLKTVTELIRPTYLFRNNDFAGRESEVVGREFADEIIIIHDVEDHRSTTELSRDIATRLAQ